MTLAADLKSVLGDTVTLYFMFHGAHWNVEGPDFSQYHGLFAEVYEDIYSAIDPVAENIRKLGDYAPFNLKNFIDDRTISFNALKTDPKSMSKSLLKELESYIANINKALKSAIDADEQGIANFLADLDDRMKKWRWQLTASTK